MPNEVNIYTPRYLAEVVRQAPPIHTYFRDTFFTNIKTFSTERVDIDLVKGDRRMAAFVHPRVGGQVLKANGFSTESYKPPLINPYDVTTADQHMTRLPGEDLYSGMTPAQRAARKLMDEYNRLNDATTRREEWMCVQAIVTGQIPIVGPGVNEVIDFGFTNKIKLDGTKQWGKTAAKPIEDLEDWTEKVLTGGFTNVDRVIMSYAADGLEKLTLLFPLATVQAVGQVYFQSIGKPKKTLLLSVLRQTVFLIPMLYILPQFWGTDGVWYAIPVAEFLSLLCTGSFIAVENYRMRKYLG